MKKLKIAFVSNLAENIPPIHKAGLEQMVYYLIEELVKRGHDITLFGTAESKTSAKLHPIWPRGFSDDQLSSIRTPETYAVWAVAEAFLHADQFDVIHDHSYFVAGHFAGLLKTPVVSTMHHPASFEDGILKSFGTEHQDYLLRLSNSHFKNLNTVCVSYFQQEQLKKLLARDSEVVHNGIPQDIWNAASLKEGEYLAYLGYISGNKGVAEAIQAVLKTDEQLVIAGPIDVHDVASQMYYEQEVKPYIDNKQIHYIGPVNLEKKIDFLQKAKGTLMPVQWDEPFGLVAIEALACGTPVIAFKRGALPEIIEDGKSGFIVETVDEMAEKIKQLDKISRANCRARFETNFTAARMAENYEKIFYQLIK